MTKSWLTKKIRAQAGLIGRNPKCYAKEPVRGAKLHDILKKGLHEIVIDMHFV